MTEWELIQQSAGEEFTNDHIVYTAAIIGTVEFAICLPDWRDPRPIAVNKIQHLRFLARQMQELWEQYGIQWVWGALVQFGIDHTYHEVWFNGERL